MKRILWLLLPVVIVGSFFLGCYIPEKSPEVEVAPDYYNVATRYRYVGPCCTADSYSEELFYRREGKRPETLARSGGPEIFAASLRDSKGVVYLEPLPMITTDTGKYRELYVLMLHTPDGGKQLLAENVKDYPAPVATDRGILFETDDGARLILRWDRGIENVPEE